MSKSTEYVIQDLVKSYKSNQVLNISRLNLTGGQFVALMGKNGSGKSTLMRLLAQQELYDAGDILFDGKSLQSTKLEVNPHVTFISEEHELPFSLALNKWVEIYSKMNMEFNSRVLQHLTQSLEIDLDKSFYELSRGQKAKAIFCLEAAKQPKVYLLDELTSVLDSGSRWTLMQFLNEEVKRGCLVTMSTNIASEMQGFATHLAFLEQGRVMFSCETKSLQEHFKKLRVPQGHDAEVLSRSGAKRIGANSDGTWLYMHRRHEQVHLPAGGQDDLREITLAEVQSYFTSGGGSL